MKKNDDQMPEYLFDLENDIISLTPEEAIKVLAFVEILQKECNP